MCAAACNAYLHRGFSRKQFQMIQNTHSPYFSRSLINPFSAMYYPRPLHALWTGHLHRVFADQTKLIVLREEFDTLQPYRRDMHISKPSTKIIRRTFMTFFNEKTPALKHGHQIVSAANIKSLSMEPKELYWLERESIDPLSRISAPVVSQYRNYNYAFQMARRLTSPRLVITYVTH